MDCWCQHPTIPCAAPNPTLDPIILIRVDPNRPPVNPMPRIVVLGTGTDVGKTYVTSRLAAALASNPNNQPVSAIKPIESGVRSSRWSSSDITQPPSGTRRETAPPTIALPATDTDAAVLASESYPIFDAPVHAYSFPEPVSPHLAARLNEVVIDISVAADWVTRFERSRATTHDTTLHYNRVERSGSSGRRSWTLIETAGAALSPLARGVTNLDFARLLEPAMWILVAPDRLGVLHDLTTTLHTMRHLGRQPDSVVLSQATAPDPSTGTNAQELRELGIAEIDAVLARGEQLPSDYLARLLQLAAMRLL
jgi:dethiobiotin synthetase